MKKTLLLAVLTVGCWGAAQAQLVLNQGDVFTRAFENLGQSGNVFTPPPGQGQFGKLALNIDSGSSGSPGSLMLEFFEGDLTEAPVFSQVLTLPAGPVVEFRVGDLWEDLQGTVRLTMTEGQLTFNSYLIEVELPTTTPGFSTLYSSGVVAVPEPSTWALAGLGAVFAIGFCSYRRRGALSAKA